MCVLDKVYQVDGFLIICIAAAIHHEDFVWKLAARIDYLFFEGSYFYSSLFLFTSQNFKKFWPGFLMIYIAAAIYS